MACRWWMKPFAAFAQAKPLPFQSRSDGWSTTPLCRLAAKPKFDGLLSDKPEVGATPRPRRPLIAALLASDGVVTRAFSIYSSARPNRCKPGALTARRAGGAGHLRLRFAAPGRKRWQLLPRSAAGRATLLRTTRGLRMAFRRWFLGWWALASNRPSIRRGQPCHHRRGVRHMGQAGDARSRTDLSGFRRRLSGAMIVDGEAFLHMETRANGLRLRLLPAEMVDEADTRDPPNGGYVVAGIEFNAAGQRVAYHVLKARPTGVFASTYGTIRVPPKICCTSCTRLGPGKCGA